MALFIADEPFSIEIDTSDPTLRRVEIRLPIAITEPNVTAPPGSSILLDFVLDTATDYASVFPYNLIDSGISPDAGPSGGSVEVVLMDSSRVQRPMRDVTLWLYSNAPDLANQPYRIDLNGGVVVLPEPDLDVATLVHPLLGMNALLDARLRIELDAQTRRFSVWVPDPQPKGSSDR